jgi:hypothetical protein
MQANLGREWIFGVAQELFSDQNEEISEGCLYEYPAV